MDDDMLTRVCQKYEKMGHSVQLKTNIIKLNQIKSDTCLQEEVIYMYILEELHLREERNNWISGPTQ